MICEPVKKKPGNGGTKCNVVIKCNGSNEGVE